MSFSLTALVQFGEETEIVDIDVGLNLSDVHAQVVAPFHLDPSQYIIQVLEKNIFNEYVNLSKLSLLNNMDSGRFRILSKKVEMNTQNITTNFVQLASLPNLQNISPQCLNRTISTLSSSSSSSNAFNTSQDNLSVSYKDPVDQMSISDENCNFEVESFDSVEESTDCGRDSKGKRALDRLRELPPLPSPFILPSIPIHVRNIILKGLFQSVIQEVVKTLANHLVDFNVSSKTHYGQIRAAFAKEFSLNNFKDNRDLDLFIQKLSRRLRDLRNRKKIDKGQERTVLDWDSNRYEDIVSQTTLSTADLTTVAQSNELKEYIKKLNDAFNNNEMISGTTTQVVVESFRIRRAYLQLGQTMQEILDEMPFTQHITFIKLEFELVTKVSLMVATQRIRKFLDTIISNVIYGALSDKNVSSIRF